VICLCFEDSLALPILGLGRLLSNIGVVVRMEPMMVMHRHHHLPLRRIGYCKAEKED